MQALLAVLGAVVLAAATRGLPLLGIPSYEPGLLFGTVALLACAHLAFERARARPLPTVRWGLLETSPGEAVWAETKVNVGAAAGLVLAPLALLTFGAIGSDCRLLEGAATYLFVAAPAALLGIALGTLAGSVSRRRRFALAIVMGCLAASALATLAEFLAGPRMIVHSLLLGPISASGYHGSDTGLDFPATALAHRAFAVVAAVGLLVLAALWRTRADAPPGTQVAPTDDAAPDDDDDDDDGGWRDSRADDAARARFLLRHHRRAVLRVLVVVGLVALPFLAAPHRSGLLSGRAPLERTLSATVETEHFRIHYAPGTAAEAHVARLGVELEWSREQVRRWLAFEPRATVDAWLHPDEATLHALTGARGFLFASPWNREFHAVLEGGRVRALRHELVHVLVADAGLWPFRTSASIGLTEGIATALDEGFAVEPEAHAQIAAAADAGQIAHAGRLLSLRGFGSGAMDRSYRSAGSFVGWLLREHGPEPLLRAYAWGRIENVYGLGLDELDAQWRQFLEEVPRTASAEAQGRDRFDPKKRPPLHARPCPRLERSERAEAAQRAAMLAREGFPEAAAEAWCAVSPSPDPAHLHAAALQHARSGRLDLALRTAERALRSEPLPPGRREQLLRLRFRLLGQGRASRKRPDASWLGPLDLAAAAAASMPRDDFDAFEAWGQWSASGLATHEDDVALEGSVLGRDDLSGAYFAAALARPPEDARLAGVVLAHDPSWPPAMSLVLSRQRADGPVSPARDQLVRAFAAAVPGPLAARYLLDVALEHERTLEWSACAELTRLALAQPRLPWDLRLAAEDLLGRAEWAPRVHVR